jgi:succinyl-CoA synthetase beta subunit
VVRLAGTNYSEGKALLDNSGLKLISADDLSDAADKIVKAI